MGHEHYEDLRAQLVSRVSPRYNPYAHVAIPLVLGFAVIAGAVACIRALAPLELVTVPLIFLISNAVEWQVHRDLLHKRVRIAPMLYDQHTSEHHVIFPIEHFAVRNPREWRWVLIPPYGILFVAAINAPLTAAIAYCGYPNIAALFIASTVGYVLLYEGLHLSFHLPEDRGIGAWTLIRILRRHHAIHHDPQLMQRCNFNITVPLWDLVRGTYVSHERREALLGAKSTLET
jgi:hypothetical protein